MNGSDKRLECDRLTQEIWEAIEKRNNQNRRLANAENGITNVRGDLSHLESDLTIRKNQLTTAKVASSLAGPII